MMKDDLEVFFLDRRAPRPRPRDSGRIIEPSLLRNDELGCRHDGDDEDVICGCKQR
jgi:hypothetical protein